MLLAAHIATLHQALHVLFAVLARLSAPGAPHMSMFYKHLTNAFPSVIFPATMAARHDQNPIASDALEILEKRPPRKIPHGDETAAPYALKRRIARLAALGLTSAEIGRELHITTSMVNRALQYSDVQARVKALQDDADAVIKEALTDGELVAAEVLYDLMKNASNEKVRLEAAIQFLDRTGSRGQPVERIQQQSVTLHGDAAQVALVNALRDPAIQEWLKQDRPDLLQKLLLPPQETPHE